MKNRILIISMFLVMFLLSGIGCTKEDDINELPPATQEGANTFGCKINGVVYKCSGYRGDTWAFIRFDGVSGYYVDGQFNINASISKNEIHKGRQIGISFNCIENQPDIYREGIKYQLQSPMEGYDSKVEITRFDKDVIAGTFQMKVQFDDDPDRTYEITEGRFDIKRNN